MAWTSRKTSTFRFRTFSPRQTKVLSWWTDGSAYKDYNGIIADGSIRSGKTMSMSLSFGLWAMTTFDRQNFAICGKTIGALRRNMIKDLRRMLEARRYMVIDRRGDNLLIVRQGGRENYFYLFGGRDERSQDLIQGITLAGVLLDEAALMPESFVNQATGRCSVTGSKLWFSCNPGNRLHWFKANWINQYKKKRLVYLRFTMDDNPSLDEQTKRRYQSMYVGAFYRRYVEGKWTAAEGVIYDMWSDDENTFDINAYDPSSADNMRRYIAVDYGTSNPTVFLDAYDDGATFWIVNEYYYDSRKEHRQKTDGEYANDFEKFIDGDRSVIAIIDPSAASFAQELRSRGYRIKSADNEVLEGIRWTATMIQKRRIKVERHRCRNLISERESYVWSEQAQMRGLEAPTKEHDHAMDALRYLIKTLVTKWRLAS